MLSKLEGIEGLAFSYHGRICNNILQSKFYKLRQFFLLLTSLKILVIREILTIILVLINCHTILGKME